MKWSQISGALSIRHCLIFFEEVLPQIWRRQPWHKSWNVGRIGKKAASYRPISLTSVVGKTMESIVNRRMGWYLETNDLLARQQDSIRMFRSTENQTTHLAQDIEDPFKKMHPRSMGRPPASFDSVLTDGLLVKLQIIQVAEVKTFLRLSLDSSLSRKFLQWHGVLQWGVLSPTFFLIFLLTIYLRNYQDGLRLSYTQTT